MKSFNYPCECGLYGNSSINLIFFVFKYPSIKLFLNYFPLSDPISSGNPLHSKAIFWLSKIVLTSLFSTGIDNPNLEKMIYYIKQIIKIVIKF